MSQAYWSPLVKTLVPYIPGEQPKVANLIKLNTNENPYPPSPLALQAMQQAVGEGLRLYPDPDASALKQAIADYYVVEQLGKLVHARRLSQEGKGDFKSRMTDNGLAVAMDSIAALPVREPVNFVIALAKAGYVYTDPLLSGRKVHSVEIPERTKAITCVILSKQLVRLLNL